MMARRYRFSHHMRGFFVGQMLAVFALLTVAGGVLAYTYLSIAKAGNTSQLRTQSGHLLQQAVYTLSTETTTATNGYHEATAGGAPGAADYSSSGGTQAAGVTDGWVIPAASGAPKTDAWGSKFKFCPWDNLPPGTSTGRLVGDTTPSQTSVVFAVISAGSDKIIQTDCAHAKTNSPQGDDGLRLMTESQVNQGVGGTVYFGDPMTTSAIQALPASATKPGQQRVAIDTGAVYVNTGSSTTPVWNQVTGGGGGGGGSGGLMASDGYKRQSLVPPSIAGFAPSTCPAGWVGVPPMNIPDGTAIGTITVAAFCVMPFPAVDFGDHISAATATNSNGNSGTVPWISISFNSASIACSLARDSASVPISGGAQLMRESQWLAIAHNMEGIAANWSDGLPGMVGDVNTMLQGIMTGAVSAAQPANYTYSANGSQKRWKFLSTGGVVYDIGGNIYQWTYLDPGAPFNGSSGLFPNAIFSAALVAAPFASQTRGMGGFSVPANMSGAVATRGGTWSGGVLAGPFALNSGGNGSTAPYVGFRCTK